MIQIRKSEERGHAQHGWLDSRHTFSFADYYDPKQMGFRSLRVLNEDRVAPGRGFGAHGHQDMEILSYVIQGSLAHKDNLGGQEVLGPNEIQHMSAGTGVVHSEFNASNQEPVHFLQIWIQPEKAGLKPKYSQIAFAPEEKQGRWKLLAGSHGGDGAARIHQDAEILVTELNRGGQIAYPLGAERHAWIHAIRGTVSVNGTELRAGDAAGVSNEAELRFIGASEEPCEVMLFNLA